MAKQQQTSTNHGSASPAPNKPGWTLFFVRLPRRLVFLARQKPRLAILVLLAIVGTIGGAAGGIVLLAAPGDQQESTSDFESVLAELDAGRFGEARRLAAELRSGGDLSYEQLGGPVYVLGAVMARDADEQPNVEERKKLYLIAARYLEEARERGLPRGREGDGLFLLGKCLYQSGLYADSLPVLHEALRHEVVGKTQVYRLLSAAYLHDSIPRLDKALDYSRQYLADRMLSPEERDAGLLQQCLILMEMGDIPSSRAALQSVLEGSSMRSEALVMEGRVLIREGKGLLADGQRKEAETRFQQARDVLRMAQAHDRRENQSLQESQYLLGVCYRNLQDYAAAEAQFSRTSTTYYNTDEGLAASFERAEVLQLRHEDQEAVEAFVRVLRDAGDPGSYNNPWISAQQFRTRMFDAYKLLCERNEYDLALKLTRFLSPMLPRDRAVELRAEVQQAWGDHLLATAVALAEQEADVAGAQARQQYRDAGNSLRNLAKLRITSREYSEYLWQSAHNFLRGHDYRSALRVLDEYLGNETRQRRPLALVGQGEALLALGKPARAIPPLVECIEYHEKHPATYRARLLAALAYAEQGSLDKAKELLIENLEESDLTPKSIEWQQSKVWLAKLLYRQGMEGEARSRLKNVDSSYLDQRKQGLEELAKAVGAFKQAIRHFGEMIDRLEDSHANDPQAIEARYLKAECHRHAAKLPRKSLAVTEIEAIRRGFNQQIAEELEAAIDGYTDLLRRLNEKQEQSGLSELERRILRNCYFMHADALFDEGKYEEAIKAYSNATNRYQKEPEALEAFLQVATCYHRLQRPADARGTYEQAKVVLQRKIAADANFQKTTRYNRERWERLLGWLSTL